MKALLFIVSIIFLVTGNTIMNEYEQDSASKLGILLLMLGVAGVVSGIMMTKPL